MKKFFVIVLLLAFAIVLSACAPRRAVQLPPTTPQATKAPEVKPEKKVPEERVVEEQIAKIETKEVETPTYVEEKSVFEDIHFDFDKYDILANAKPTLQSIADWLIKNKSVMLLIEGHCDERGTNEYNLALGDRRAKQTQTRLLELCIASGMIQRMSYGEAKL